MTGTEYKVGIKSFVKFIFSHQIRYVYYWRKASKKETLFRKLRMVKYSRKYGLEISTDAHIGRGLYLGHPYNITVAGGGLFWAIMSIFTKVVQ